MEEIMGREYVFNKIAKTVYPRVLEIVKEIKNLKVSYSGLFKHVTDEYFEKYNDSWTIINGNSIDTNELKFFQCMIFQALKDCGFDYHDIQFADDTEDSELKNQTITYRKHRLLGDYKHWINNPCNVDDYRLPGYGMDWRGRLYPQDNIYDFQSFKALRAMGDRFDSVEYDMRASGIRILGCLLRDSGLVLDLIDPAKGDIYHNKQVSFKDGESIKKGLMEYIYGFGRDEFGQYIRDDMRERPYTLNDIQIPGDWKAVDDLQNQIISEFNKDDKEIYYKLPDGFIVDFKKYHKITINLNENWCRNGLYASEYKIPELEKDERNIYSIAVDGFDRTKNGWWMKGVVACIIHAWDAWLLREVYREFHDNFKGSIHDCYILKDISFDRINSFVSNKLAWIYKNADVLMNEINNTFGIHIEPKEFNEDIYQKIQDSESVKIENQGITGKVNSQTYFEYEQAFSQFFEGYDWLIRTRMIPDDIYTKFLDAYKRLECPNTLVDEYIKNKTVTKR